MAQEAMLAVAKGGDPAAEKKAERGAGSFIELADRYLDHAKRHNKSWKQGRALVERFAIPRWSKLRASSITRGDVKQMMSKIEAPIVPVERATKRRCRPGVPVVRFPLASCSLG